VEDIEGLTDVQQLISISPSANRRTRSPSQNWTASGFAFLPRHGRGILFPPPNYRPPNIYALKSLGVSKSLRSAAAQLQTEYARVI